MTNVKIISVYVFSYADSKFTNENYIYIYIYIYFIFLFIFLHYSLFPDP